MWNADEARVFAGYLSPQAGADQDRVVDAVLQAGERVRQARHQLTEEVEKTSIGHVRGFLAAEVCDRLDQYLRERTEIVVERVEASEGRWQIDLIDNAYLPLAETVAHDPFSVLCLSTHFISAMAEISGFSRRTITTRRWVNRYAAGDSITPHDDTTGDYQIMICVDAPPVQYGGELQFEDGTSADLQRGDLLIMRHAGLVHWTTPLAEDTPGERATATCRYYVEDGRLPRSKVYAHSLAGPKTNPLSQGD